MFELLTHEAVVNYLEDDEWTENEALKHIPNARDPEYSGALTELIKLCLKPKPWDRPSVEELEIKIKTMCQSIVNEHAANPSLQEQDRLYYRGSEISQMPPGNWHYWRSLMEYVPRPSETPDRVGDPKNPFTNTIIYPHFPTSKIDGLDEDEEEEHSDDSDKGPDVDGAGEPVAALNDPSSSPNGNHADRPIVVSSTGNDADHAVVVSSTGNDADHAVVVSSTGNDADHAVVVSSTGNDADHPVVISDSSESNESHASHRSGDNRSSGGGSNSSNSSDDSETRRRMAIKTLPGA